jgi:hypothetical protein
VAGARAVIGQVLVLERPAGIEPVVLSLEGCGSTIELRTPEGWMQRPDSHRRPLGYEPSELLLLHSAPPHEGTLVPHPFPVYKSFAMTRLRTLLRYRLTL